MSGREGPQPGHSGSRLTLRGIHAPTPPGPEVAHAVNEIVGRLLAGQRRVLTDAVAGYGVAEIAAREGVNTVAVKARLSRARATLREALYE
jgi:DNA-directed RNA polymerase specialized sigma24 family protein